MSRIIKYLAGYFILFLIVTLFFVYWLERFEVLKTDFVVSRVSNVINGLAFSQEKTTIGADNDAFLLEKLRLSKQQENLANEEANLGVREGQLITKEQELQVRETQLEEAEKKIEEQKKSLNQLSKRFENRNEVLRYNVQALFSMPPQNAVDILEGYADQLLIDTLVVADTISRENNTQSLVPYWLSLMDAVRAAELQKKLVYRN